MITSCVDREFDEPPLNGEDPSIDASLIMNVSDILGLWEPGEFVEIGVEKYLEVIVVADDRTGNFFRSLVVQDETGGLTVLLDDVELWNKYFVGKRIYIDLSQLWVSDYNGLPQIGYTPFDDDGQMTLGRVPAVLINDIVIGGSFNHEVLPNVRTIGDLSSGDLNTLVQLDDVQFVSGILDDTYADAENLIALNQVLENCSGNKIIVRTSGYSDFASRDIPDGKGSLVAIYSVFGSDKQLLIRDINEVMLEGERCDNNNTVEINPEDIITVTEMMQNYSPGVEVPLNMDKYLEARVVSNDEAGNFYKSLVVQDETGGIAILADAFDLYQSYPPGQSVYVSLKDLCISDYNGLPQLCYTNSTANVKRIPETEVSNVIIASGNVETVDPETISLGNVSLTKLNTLVRLNDVQFVPGSANMTYADADNQFSVNHTIEDCDGNEIVLRTSGFADFADQLTPTGNGSVTAVLQIFSGTLQLYLRDLDDVSMNGSRCGDMGGGTGINEGFESLNDFDPIFLSGWTNVATKGDRIWIKRSFDGNGFAETEAYQDTNPETDTWLVTPEINTAETPSLSFRTAMAFYQHDGLTVSVSSDFQGDVEAATWEALDVTIATNADGNYNWVDSGVVELSVYGSNVHVAFRYQGTSASNTTKMRVDDIVVE